MSVPHRSAPETAFIEAQLANQIIGDPADAAAKAVDLMRCTAADELMELIHVHDHEARVRSYALLADAMSQTG